MSRRDKKFITQEIFNALSSSSKTGKTTQLAFDLSDNGRKKLKIEAAMDDLTPSEKAREALGLSVKAKKARPKLILRLTEEDFHYLAERYGVDADDKLTIRTKAADELAMEYPDEEVDIKPNYQWPDP